MKHHQRGHIEVDSAPWQPMRRIRQWLCSHRFDLADLSPRDANGIVHCRCYKCDGTFSAEYGLALPGMFDRNTTSSGGQDAAKEPDRG